MTSPPEPAELRVVVLLSGGADSVAMLYEIAERHPVACLSVDYGQPHREEIDHAARHAVAVGAPHLVLGVPSIEGVGDANVYPGRNGVLLALAASHALSIGAGAVAIGCNRDDWQDYLDCRPVYLHGWSGLLHQLDLILLHPNLHRTKQQVVKNALDHGWPVEDTRSCYQSGNPCGECPACRLRTAAGL